MKKSLVLILLIGAISFMGFSKTTPDLRQNSSHEEFIPMDVENVLAINVDSAIAYTIQEEACTLVKEFANFSEEKNLKINTNAVSLNIDKTFKQKSLQNLNLETENSKLLKNPRDGLRC